MITLDLCETYLSTFVYTQDINIFILNLGIYFSRNTYSIVYSLLIQESQMYWLFNIYSVLSIIYLHLIIDALPILECMYMKQTAMQLNYSDGNAQEMLRPG